jgi:hypothetical protein
MWRIYSNPDPHGATMMEVMMMMMMIMMMMVTKALIYENSLEVKSISLGETFLPTLREVTVKVRKTQDVMVTPILKVYNRESRQPVHAVKTVKKTSVLKKYKTQYCLLVN